jgi:hypothetical protein
VVDIRILERDVGSHMKITLFELGRDLLLHQVTRVPDCSVSAAWRPQIMRLARLADLPVVT